MKKARKFCFRAFFIISVSRIGTFLALTRDYGFDEDGVFYPAFL